MPSYAIVEDRGRYLRVEAGKVVRLDLRAGREGDEVRFERVLLLGGDPPKVGRPYVEGASVRARIQEPVVKGDKVYTVRFRRCKNSRRRTGFRARYTLVKIEEIQDSHGS